MRSTALLVASLSVACTPEGATTQADPAPVADATPTSAPPSPSSPEPESTPEPKPEPEPEPPPPNAEPATLHLAAYGRCHRMGVSVLDGQSFIHYNKNYVSYIHRMDERGAVAESYPLDAKVSVSYGELYDKRVKGLRGRWPNQVFVLANYYDRETSVSAAFRLADGDWTRVKARTKTAGYEDLWPWYDDSILAVSTDLDSDRLARLVVIRGEPKGRSLGPIRRKGRCESWTFNVQDVHPRDDGGLTLLAECNGEWLAQWSPAQDDPTITKLGPESDRGQLMLDAEGQGFIALDDGVLQWRDGKAQPLPLPSTHDLDGVGMSGDDRLWIHQDDAVSQWTGDQWEPMLTLPEYKKLAVYGIAEGTPWIWRGKAKGQTPGVAMQTSDGVWHEVSLPPTPDLDKIPRPSGVQVAGPGDVWVPSVYFKMNKRQKSVGKRMHAVYTTRPVQEPLHCK